jgi:hypothetical protein
VTGKKGESAFPCVYITYIFKSNASLIPKGKTRPVILPSFSRPSANSKESAPGSLSAAGKQDRLLELRAKIEKERDAYLGVYAACAKLGEDSARPMKE